MSDSLPAKTEPPREATTIGEHGVELRTSAQLIKFAELVVKSKLAPKGMEQPEQVFIAIQAGMELGFSPMRALSAVAVVNGRPSLMGEAALAKIRESKVCSYGPIVTHCGDGESLRGSVKFARHDMGAEIIEVTFSVADAKRAGLWSKAGPWTQYPMDMLEWRAVARACKRYFSDVLMGLTIAEEAQDYPVIATAVVPARSPQPDPLLLDARPATDTPETAERTGVTEPASSASGAAAAPSDSDVFDPGGYCRGCQRERAQVEKRGHAVGCEWHTDYKPRGEQT